MFHALRNLLGFKSQRAQAPGARVHVTSRQVRRPVTSHRHYAGHGHYATATECHAHQCRRAHTRTLIRWYEKAADGRLNHHWYAPLDAELQSRSPAGIPWHECLYLDPQHSPAPQPS